MNSLLLEDHQFTGPTCAKLSLRQQEHIIKILKGSDGDSLTVGAVNGLMGKARLSRNADAVELTDICLDQTPPKPLPITLVLALPRPQMLKRILQTVTMFGVERLALIQTQRVEKSFWQSPSATDSAIRDQLILGLEQAKATQLPEVLKYKRFKPFIEDELDTLCEGCERLVAHPGDFPFSPTAISDNRTVMAIGPEGGFTDYEAELWQAHQFSPVQLGPRIFKVETAVTAVLSRML